MFGFILYEGTYHFQGSLIHWKCSCSEFVFEARHIDHPPTQLEVEAAPKDHFTWSHITLLDHMQRQNDVWIKHFDGAEPLISTFRFDIDKQSKH